MFSNKQLDWDEYEKILDENDGAFILCLGTVKDCLIAYEKELPFYYGFPITTYDELNSIVEFEPEYLVLGPPLFFNMAEIRRKYNIPIRIFPNVNNLTNFPKVRAETGCWIRPEDIDYYDEFADTVEFVNLDTLEQERALFRIYSREKEFIGPIGLIISGMGEWEKSQCDLVNSDFIHCRVECKQKCESGERRCGICRNLLYLAQIEVLKPVAEQYRRHRKQEEQSQT